MEKDVVCILLQVGVLGYLLMQQHQVLVYEELGLETVCVGYALVVVVVVVETTIGVVDVLASLIELWGDEDVLENLTLGVAHEHEHVGAVNLVAGKAVVVALAFDPVLEDVLVALDFLGLERDNFAAWRFVVLYDGVFKDVYVGVALQDVHVVVVCARCNGVVAVDKCDVFAACCCYACVACR